MGLEPGRLQFSWVSSAESIKFVDVVKEVTSVIKGLGPNTHFAEKPFEGVDKDLQTMGTE